MQQIFSLNSATPSKPFNMPKEVASTRMRGEMTWNEYKEEKETNTCERIRRMQAKVKARS